MPLSKWNNIPKVMDVKMNQVPYVVLCQINGYKTNKRGTYPLFGFSKDIVVDWSGSIGKVSGVITTEYEQMVPFIVVGILTSTGLPRHRLIVPIFDYDTWSLALGNPEPDDHIDYGVLLNTICHNSTLGFSKVTT